MIDQVHNTIVAEAQKLICRHQRYAYDLRERQRRIERRSGQRCALTVLSPGYWSVSRGFNPYHVRSRARQISRAISSALRRRTYRPRPAVEHHVPKTGGGDRRVSVFQVADSAISRLVYERLLEKNSSLLSSRCFSYRRDLSLHDAISHVASSFRGAGRLFIAEFDFRRFFESVDHEHIRRVLRDRRFYLTDNEREVIDAFLAVPTLPTVTYDDKSRDTKDRGIHLGTPLSLFLANVAAYPLDRRLELLPVDFARFSDDVLIWSDDYSHLCEAVRILQDAANEMGVELSFTKSPGVNILVPAQYADGRPSPAAEFRSTTAVNFLGYSISASSISIRDSAKTRIKTRIAYLIYSNLLEPIKRGNVVPGRFASPVDRDYVTMIFQIRRYLYGDLSESQLRRYLSRDVTRVRFRGLMSFYPLVDDVQQLGELDGWLLHTVFTSLRRRTKLLRTAGHTALPTPHGVPREDLRNVVTRSSDGSVLDLRLPSFLRMSKLLRRLTAARGPSAIAHPRSNQYYIA